MIVLMFVLMFLLFVLTVPVATSLGLASAITVLGLEMPAQLIAPWDGTRCHIANNHLQKRGQKHHDEHTYQNYPDNLVKCVYKLNIPGHL